MKIYDISLPISDSLMVWPGDAPVRITYSHHLDEGDSATVGFLKFGAHTGTHIDAPAHFIQGGAELGTLALSLLVGPALVVHVPEDEALSASVLQALAIPPGAERILFRTRNSELWAQNVKTFREDFVAVTEDGARWLVAHGARVVGVDYLSVGPFGNTGPTHRVLLEAGVIPVEGLNLSQVPPGIYQFVCLPLRTTNIDGAPARAILIDDSEE